MTTQTSITEQLAQLPSLPMENLWALWDEFFEQRPAHHNRTYIENRLAYKLQERTFGGISTTLRRRLERIGETGEVPNQKRRAETQFAPGTTMVREYNGITYQVAVLADGRFELDGRPFKSLSGVAKAITGTSHSGPVFFGLKPSARDRKKEQL